MKTYVYLFFCLFSLMGFQACSNDEVDNVKTTTSNDVEAISASSSLITSEEAKNNIPAFTEAIEAENTLLGLSSRATSMDASDRRTIGKKQHKGLSTLKLSCPHSYRFSSCFPAVQTQLTRFLGDFRHFQGFLYPFPLFWLLRPLCASYRLLHASILETQVLPQAADLLWAWCPFFFGDYTVPAYRCNPPSWGLRVFP